jgi:hypothetical protein
MIFKRKICKCGKKAVQNRRKCYQCILADKRKKAEAKLLSKQKKKARHEQSESYRKTLFKKAWGIMSKHIRLKYADDNGMVACYTCGNIHHYKEMHCGHFWHDRLDFCEDNLRPQCNSCNTYKADKSMAVYAAKLLDELGLEKFKALRLQANTFGNGYSIAELHTIIKTYEKN